MRGLDSLGMAPTLSHGKPNVLDIKNLLILSTTGKRSLLFVQFNNKLEWWGENSPLSERRSM